MDLLSQVTASMRTERPRWERAEVPPARLRFEPVAGAAFQLVLCGSVTLAPADGDAAVLDEGDVALLPGGHAHALERRVAGTVVISGVFPLDPGRCHPVVNDLPVVIRVPAQPRHEPSQWHEPPQPLSALLDLLRREWEHSGMGSDAAVGALLDTLLLYVLRWWYERHGTDTGWGPALNDPAISRALCAMHNSPGAPWTVERLGAVAGLSRSTFARRFTELVGRPPLGQLTWVRLNSAADRLRASDEPLSAVAQRVGYASEFAFSAAFKREFGTAPGAYRRESAAADPNGPRSTRSRQE